MRLLYIIKLLPYGMQYRPPDSLIATLVICGTRHFVRIQTRALPTALLTACLWPIGPALMAVQQLATHSLSSSSRKDNTAPTSAQEPICSILLRTGNWILNDNSMNISKLNLIADGHQVPHVPAIEQGIYIRCWCFDPWLWSEWCSLFCKLLYGSAIA